MEDFRTSRATTVDRLDASIDQGLRSYMLGVYNLMAVGLVITGIAAIAINMLATTTDPSMAVGQIANGVMLTQLGALIYTTPLKFVVMFAPLIAVFFLSFKITSMNVSTARGTFMFYAALVGISISYIFIIYTAQSIVQTFFITAAAFASLSLYGYTTKRDLTAMGAFLIMGLFGLIIAMIVNIFMQSSALGFAVSIAGVVIFAGLTAYDTQKIKEMYLETDSVTRIGQKAVLGALALYLDFINLFMFLLRFMGSNRN